MRVAIALVDLQQAFIAAVLDNELTPVAVHAVIEQKAHALLCGELVVYNIYREEVG